MFDAAPSDGAAVRFRFVATLMLDATTAILEQVHIPVLVNSTSGLTD